MHAAGISKLTRNVLSIDTYEAHRWRESEARLDARPSPRECVQVPGISATGSTRRVPRARLLRDLEFGFAYCGEHRLERCNLR